MNKTFHATASITIKASPSRVWQELTKPKFIEQYLFGRQASHGWHIGSPILYRGVWQGKNNEAKGEFLEVEPERLVLSSSWNSPSAVAGIPTNFMTVRYELAASNDGTELTLIQENDETQDGMAEASQQDWLMTLEDIKRLLESELQNA